MPTLKPRAYAASMGPRLVNRGNPCSCWILEAVRTASMGPRLVNRGNQAYNRYYCRCGYWASMGPRLVNRGNGANSCQLLKFLSASMGPRLVNRGNLINLPKHQTPWAA